MVFLLSSHNVFEYLIEQRICDPKEQYPSQIKPKDCKNFNLLVSFANDRHLLVKQERHDSQGRTHGEFWNEWRIQQFLQTLPALSPIRSLISEVIHFDPSRSIIVLNYLNDYCDLADFYYKEQRFPTTIAAAVGVMLATIHRTTLEQQAYQDCLNQNGRETSIDKAPNLLRGLEQIGPEIFGRVCADGLKFFRLYQRYESLGQAISELNAAWSPCCLIHYDLRLSNLLLHLEWEQVRSSAEPSHPPMVRLIDWEKFKWGDPAYDLGTLIAGYLKLWLRSLVVNSAIDVETALRLAETPLEQIQPSLVALTQAYFEHFPTILERRPDFFRRVLQFAGFLLIKKIWIKIDCRKPFDNRGICMLQAAKTLLCYPEQSIPAVFGVTASELITPSLVTA